MPFSLISDMKGREDLLNPLADGSTIHMFPRSVTVPAEAAAINPDGAVIGAWKFDQAAFEAMPRLLVVARFGIGYDTVDVPAATRAGVAVVNTPYAPLVNTAEHTVALLMALAKNLKLEARRMASGETRRGNHFSVELEGKTLGLVGMGRIGSRVAQICSAGLRMNVIAYDPWLTQAQAQDLGVTLYPSLADVLSRADFVSLHVPLSPETRHLIGPRELAQMKPSAFLLNASRGPVVDEAALTQALKFGQIAGAGLDVWDPEPPQPTNPLLQLDNVVGTPHSAGQTPESNQRCAIAMMKGALNVLKGMRPDGLVNPDVWDSPARIARLAKQ